MDSNYKLVATSVRHLQAGDFLLGSQRTVVSTRPSTISPGKRMVTVRDAKGVEHAYAWGASTTMTVRRYQP